VFLVLVTVLLVLLVAHGPLQPLLGCAVVLLGVPAYNFFGRRLT
jgi:hypothetical protein